MKRVVDPPGPKAKATVERDKKVLSPYNRPYYYPFVVEKGKGCITTRTSTTATPSSWRRS